PYERVGHVGGPGISRITTDPLPQVGFYRVRALEQAQAGDRRNDLPGRVTCEGAGNTEADAAGRDACELQSERDQCKPGNLVEILNAAQIGEVVGGKRLRGHIEPK